jgi:eukaryotic-like serine/threonine-protein kinase
VRISVADAVDTERWQKIKSVAADAIERDPDTRGAFLERACDGDAELRREVDRLLAAHEGHDTLLDASWLGARDTTTTTRASTTSATTSTTESSSPSPAPAAEEETWTSRLGRYVFPRRARAERAHPGIHERAANRLRTLAFLQAAGLLIGYAVYELSVHGVGRAEYIQRPHTPGQILLVIFGAIALVAAWLSRASLTRDELVRLGLSFEVVSSIGIALVTYSWTPPKPVWGVSWLCVWITIFPLVVPAPPRLAAAAAFASAAMAPLALWLWVVIGHAKAPSWSVAVATTAPNFVCAFLAWLGARSIHQMGLDLRRLGSYRLVSRLAQGGMGEVWVAEHDLLARPAALKLVRSDVVGLRAEHAAQRLEQEAQSTATLTSPHTVKLYDFGVTDGGTFYYVMELLEGFDLETLVRRFGPVPPNRTIHLLRQICESLAEAHARQLVHRDIKPSNVFVCRQGLEADFIKVLDFGIVRRMDVTPEIERDRARRVEGSPGFIAPEALRRGVSNPRTDLYSLGCVGYWLLTGETPDMTNGHSRDARLASFGPDVPPALADTIVACLERDPDQRPDSAESLSSRLAAVALPPWSAGDANRWWSENFKAS